MVWLFDSRHFFIFFAYDSDQAVIIHSIVSDGESQADTLLDKRPRGESKVSGGVFQGAPAGSQYHIEKRKAKTKEAPQCYRLNTSQSWEDTLGVIGVLQVNVGKG